jgi:hypothetical protein
MLRRDSVTWIAQFIPSQVFERSALNYDAQFDRTPIGE